MAWQVAAVTPSVGEIRYFGRATVSVPLTTVSETCVTVESSTAAAEVARVHVVAPAAALVKTLTVASPVSRRVKESEVREPVRVSVPAPVSAAQPPPAVAVNAVEDPSASRISTEVAEVLRSWV